MPARSTESICYRGRSVALLLESEKRPGERSDDCQTQIAAIDALARGEGVDQADEDLFVFVPQCDDLALMLSG